MFAEIHSLDEFNQLLAEQPAIMAYFSTDGCNVCKILKPKVERLVHDHFPEILLVYIETNKFPELAAQNRIFAVPTLLVFFESREYIRKSRNFGLDELGHEIERPYGLMFS